MIRSAVKYIFILFACALFVRCSDLDETPYTTISPASFFKNADDLDKALIGVYDGYQNAYGRDSRGYYLKLICLSEFGAPAYTKNDPQLYNSWFDVNNPSMTVDVWADSYKIINLANLVLGKGKDIDMDEALKNRMFGEARFLRGLTYFNLLRLYGGVAIPKTYTEDLNGLEIPRASADSTYDYVIEDLKYAADNLPAKSAYESDDIWRATKGAALAMLGKVYLYRGSMTGDEQYFQKSEEYSNEVMKSTEYSLEPDFRDLWKWWNSNNENNIESIFEIQLGYKSGENNTLHTDAGINITDESLGGFMYRRFGPSFTAYNSFSDGDYRKSSTFLTQVTLSTGKTIKWVESDNGFYPGSQGWQTSGPGMIKYYDRTSESYTTTYAGSNIYVMRYAEVLLNYAEADNHVHGGPTKDAYVAINRVRHRAHLSDLTAGLSEEQFDDSVYRERGWEFIGEGQLYYDGIRTGKIGPAVQKEVNYGVDHKLYLYSPLQFVPTQKFLWKIPTYDLDSNPALQQNPDNVSG